MVILNIGNIGKSRDGFSIEEPSLTLSRLTKRRLLHIALTVVGVLMVGQHSTMTYNLWFAV